VHCWTGTLYNGYSVEVEQRCTFCHEYRHHTFADIVPLGKFETRWQPGRHPNRHLATERLDRRLLSESESNSRK
jgi:hypothetical protein